MSTALIDDRFAVQHHHFAHHLFSMATSAPDTRKRLERFFIEALNGYVERHSRQEDQDAALKSISEAIIWACALDEHHMKTDPTYSARRDADADGALMRGIRYARNRVAHQAAEIVELAGGAFFPVQLAAPMWEFCWRATKDLPPADPKHDNLQQRQVYEVELEGTPARFALSVIVDWFDRV